MSQQYVYSENTVAGIKNLTPWPKGTSGNPKGKPIGARNRTTINREIADMMLSDLGISLEHLPAEMDVAKAASIQLWRKGILESDTTAIRDALDNAFGKNADVLQADVTTTINIIDAETPTTTKE